MDETSRDPSKRLADDVDKALEALWQGESGAFTRLLGDQNTGPHLGELRAAVVAQTHLDSSVALPDRIGEYEIVREIGRGGMGVVYEARQLEPERLVALKVIRGSEQLDEVHVRLFEREVRTLARLQHPGIASVYSAGHTDDGRPYFAMELVGGETLRRYAQSSGQSTHAKDLSQRLDLFGQICDAINHAHQRGVIHRDLKPSNILVTEAPSASGSSGALGASSCGRSIKILDFGLAHLAGADEAQSTLVTEPGRVVGTLSYMSPEQARGDVDAVDLRSDIYALGVILFELLTGQLPYPASHRTPQQAIHSICEVAPQKPSSINRALRGEIETIVLKALEKEPERRYASAAGLADDIRRYLAGQPILARPPSTAYQIRKLVSRHRISAALALLLLVSVVSSAIVAGVQAARYARQRDIAVLAEQNEASARVEAEEARSAAVVEAEKARRIQFFLEDILASVDPSRAQGRDAGLLTDLLAEAARQVETELSDQPEVAAAIRTTIGRTYSGLGLFDMAEPHLRAALEYHETEYGPDDPRVTPALSHLGQLLTRRGDCDEAEQLLRRAVRIQEAQAEDAVGLAQSLSDLGMLMGYTNAFDPAEQLLRRALDIRRQALGDGHRLTADGAGNLAWLLGRRDNVKESLPAFRNAVALARQAYGAAHPKTAMCLNNLASVLKKAGEYAEADEAYSASLAIQREVLGDTHPDLADGLVSYADLLKHLGKYAEAESLLDEALDIQRDYLGEQSDFYAAALAHLASVKIRQGDYDAAESGYRRAAEIYRGLHGDQHMAVLMCENALATLLVRAGRYAEAEPVLRNLQELFPQLYGADHPGAAVIDTNLATALTHLGQLDEAESLYRGVLTARRDRYGQEHPLVARGLHNLAGVLQSKGRWAEAEESYRRCLAIERKVEGGQHPNVGATLTKLAILLSATAQPDEAAAVFDEAFDIHRQAFPEGHPVLTDTVNAFGGFLLDHDASVEPARAETVLRAFQASIREESPGDDATLAAIENAIGGCLMRMEQYAEAERLLVRSCATLEESLGVDHPYAVRARTRLVRFFENIGDPEQAEIYRAVPSEAARPE